MQFGKGILFSSVCLNSVQVLFETCQLILNETCGFSINAWSEKSISNNSGGNSAFLLNQRMKLV